MADFLREIRDVTLVSRQLNDIRNKTPAESIRRPDTASEKLPDMSLESAERAVFIAENDEKSTLANDSSLKDEGTSEVDYRDNGGMIYFLY